MGIRIHIWVAGFLYQNVHRDFLHKISFHFLLDLTPTTYYTIAHIIPFKRSLSLPFHYCGGAISQVAPPSTNHSNMSTTHRVHRHAFTSRYAINVYAINIATCAPHKNIYIDTDDAVWLYFYKYRTIR